MFCSTIIATIGRASLARTVESALAQGIDPQQHEVIVVNDSGKPLLRLGFEADPRVQVITTHKRERCVARNTGAAIARGDYLHFLDDDDWLAPGALAALMLLAQEYPLAGFLYGATQVVDRHEQPVIQLRPQWTGNASVQTMAGEWLPLQSALVATKQFFGVGCFNVLIPSAEDIDLLRRLTLVADVATTEAVVAWVGMGEANSTTDYINHDNLARSGREQALSYHQAFGRMRAAALTPGWQGRLVRIYLTSAVWNLRQGNWSTALGRGLTSLRAAVSAGPALLQSEFYRAVLRRYESDTFARGFHAVPPAGGQQPLGGQR